ncbi:MAG: BMP family ABC transporter substrate-binding protein [Polyangiales bacterium]
MFASRTALALITLTALAVGLSLPRGRKDVSARSPQAHRPNDAFRVGLVFDIGGRGDKSFNDSAYLGLTRAKNELGVQVEMVEPTGAEDREAALRLFGARGFSLVIGVRFIFSRDVDTVATDYPSARFACVDYSPSFVNGVRAAMPPNVTGLSFREEEGSFLVGAVAGLRSTTHHVGFVGGMDIPLIHKFEAGYREGVRATCASCVVHVAYAGSTPDAFRDPARGKSIAIAQIGLGADILFHASGSTGHGVFEGAHEAHVFAIGVDSDQHDDLPGTVLTSMVKRVDVAVFDAIEQARKGALKGGMLDLGLKEGGVDYVHEGAHAEGLDEAIRARVETLREAIVRGEVRVPTE